MGAYLNSKKSGAVYKNMVQSSYFVDKTAILGELIPMVEQDPAGAVGKDIRYICVTRPRRFDKTVMASMIALFFGRGGDSGEIFRKLSISGHEGFERHLNKHNVIHITFNEMPDECGAYNQYITRIKRRLRGDLRNAFPDIEIEDDAPVWDILNDIYEYEDEARFIFVLDEWDFIYHQDFVTEKEKEAFTRFLSILLKDQPYVEMAYMTGILPISKYSSGSGNPADQRQTVHA